MAGMSETFTFIAPIMPKRRFDPFALRIGIAAAVFMTFVGVFAVFVVSHEHLADARREAAETAQRAQEQARAAASASPAQPDPALARLLDGDARQAAERALALARTSLASAGSWARAEAADLATGPTSYLFVDGPSSSPQIVSVYASDNVWGAAVLGTSGVCYWVSASTTGPVRYGTGSTCTGQAALGADNRSWSAGGREAAPRGT
jgi:hypothetical protein